MALENKNKSISLSAQSVIKGETFCMFSASIDSVNLNNVSIGRSILNNAGYRENRAECIADQTAFEDAVYAIVDSMTPKEARSETI